MVKCFIKQNMGVVIKLFVNNACTVRVNINQIQTLMIDPNQYTIDVKEILICNLNFILKIIYEIKWTNNSFKIIINCIVFM